jgi:hypothetical protein
MVFPLVREVVKAKLEFYRADENSKMLYEFIKPLVDKMSEAELNAPAFYGSEDGILNVNAGSEGLQIMRFNPEYWDRTLPPSAIQFITMGYFEFGSGNMNGDEQKNAGDDYLKNNGHPDYASLMENSLPIKALPGLIAVKKTIGSDMRPLIGVALYRPFETFPEPWP